MEVNGAAAVGMWQGGADGVRGRMRGTGRGSIRINSVSECLYLVLYIEKAGELGAGKRSKTYRDVGLEPLELELAEQAVIAARDKDLHGRRHGHGNISVYTPQLDFLYFDYDRRGSEKRG